MIQRASDVQAVSYQMQQLTLFDMTHLLLQLACDTSAFMQVKLNRHQCGTIIALKQLLKTSCVVVEL